MERTVVGSFATRRDAEIAVEHLVQQHGVDRTDVSVRAAGDANSAGTRKAGADLESSHRGTEKRGQPELSGPVEVSVDCRGKDTTPVETAFKEAGATQLRRQ